MKRTELTITRRPETFLQSINDMHSKIARRAYELFASNGFADGHDLEDWFSAEQELFGKTPIELVDNDKEFTITAGVPGFAGKEVEIRLDPWRVFITAKREEKSEDQNKRQTVYSERSDEMVRTIDLPAEVDPDSNGELEITLAGRTPPRRCR
jgi:HSP20 family molecular chaperone IbpA